MTENQTQNRTSFGRRHEYIAIADLLRQGFDVYIPLVDDRQIDIIIRCDDDHYIDIQHKSKLKDGNFAAIKMPDPRPNYFFMFYVERMKTRWIIPSVKLFEMAKPEGNGKYGVYLSKSRTNKFREYIDADGTFERLRGDKEV